MIVRIKMVNKIINRLGIFLEIIAIPIQINSKFIIKIRLWRNRKQVDFSFNLLFALFAFP